MEDIIKSVVGSVIVAVLSGLFFWLRKKYSLVLSRRDPRIPSYFLGSIIIIWFFAGIFIHYLVFTNDSLLWLLPVYLVWSFSLVYYFWNQRQEFRTVGIKGADKEVRHGIDYKRSLKLCNNRLKFLGIGASKLTEQKEFEKVIRRCAPDEPIKFLLCKPTHDCLVEAAKRFGVDRDKYKNRAVQPSGKSGNKRTCRYGFFQSPDNWETFFSPTPFHLLWHGSAWRIIRYPYYFHKKYR